ncbi:MAG: hypothetical protein ACK4QP_14590 [Pseudorhizobium sp.]
MRAHKVVVLTLLVGASLTSDGSAQSQFSPTADPADIYEYDVDTKAIAPDENLEEALAAVRAVGSAAAKVQKTVAVGSFRFLVLDPGLREEVQSEASKRQDELLELQTAVRASAVFYTAIEREGIQPEDIVAVVIEDIAGGLPSEKSVTMYVMPQNY